jgi:GntR family transcriptional regulator, carbon starvation induced regulator
MPVTAEIQSVDDKSAVSLTTQAYETLRQDILAGVLPPGKKLRIEELKETYGIGASAIREALSMLISDILVQRIDHRGFRVAEVSLSGFDELLKTRSWLEEQALRESIRLGDISWEEALVLANFHLSRVHQTDTDDRFLANDLWEEHHKSLHKALIGACGSGLLLHFCEQMYDLNIRYRRVVGSPVENARDVKNEHDAIVQATLTRDSDRAVTLLLQHYSKTAELVRNKLK